MAVSDIFELDGTNFEAILEKRRAARARAPGDIQFLAAVNENPGLVSETLVRAVYDMRRAMEGTRIKNWKRRLLLESILRIEMVIFAEQQRTNLD